MAKAALREAKKKRDAVKRRFKNAERGTRLWSELEETLDWYEGRVAMLTQMKREQSHAGTDIERFKYKGK